MKDPWTLQSIPLNCLRLVESGATAPLEATFVASSGRRGRWKLSILDTVCNGLSTSYQQRVWQLSHPPNQSTLLPSPIILKTLLIVGRQCDRAEPTCSQCVRASFSCPGYRDPQQVYYRNENEKVRSRVRSAQYRTERQVSSAKEITPQSRRAFKAAVVAQSLQSLPASLPSSTSAESVGFFFRYYVLDDVHNIPIYLSASQMEVLAATNPLVMQSLVAVGLAGLSNIKKSTELMTKATGEYTQALHLINCTLKDGTQCKSDATLAATMLLGMFEVGWVTLFRVNLLIPVGLDLQHSILFTVMGTACSRCCSPHRNARR